MRCLYIRITPSFDLFHFHVSTYFSPRLYLYIVRDWPKMSTHGVMRQLSIDLRRHMDVEPIGTPLDRPKTVQFVKSD